MKGCLGSSVTYISRCLFGVGIGLGCQLTNMKCPGMVIHTLCVCHEVPEGIHM